MDTVLLMNKPASWWGNQYREGLPLGNGFTGALVYGGAMREKIMLSHTCCWREGSQKEIPDVSDVLPEMRKRILEHRVPEADRMLCDALEQRGYSPQEAYPFPIADILVTTPAREGRRHYRRMLNLSKEEATVQYEDGGYLYTRDCFVSRFDCAVYLRIRSEADLSDVKIRLSLHEGDLSATQNGPLPEITAERSGGEWQYLAVTAGGAPYGAVGRVIRRTHEILVIAKVFPCGNPEEQFEKLKREIEQLPTDYSAAMAAHEPLHREIFERCSLHLPDPILPQNARNDELITFAEDQGTCPNALTEKLWAFGRYLLICASTPGSYPCALMGLWGGAYREGWAFNMANINLEMIYWLASEGGMPELLLSVFDYYESMMEGLRENARKVYGCRGILISAVSTPGTGRMTCLLPHIVNWTGGAAWIAQFYYDYWLFTRDEQFLRNRAYPFLKETALFYQDFLVWQGSTWHVIPSVSPENHSSSYAGRAELPGSMQTAIDATMDIALAKEVFSNLLKIGERCGAGEEEMRIWKKMLDGAPEYTVDENGAVHEWNHPDFPDRDTHRHQSHLYPMFPGFEQSRGEGRKPFAAGAYRRLNRAISDHSGWGLMNASAAMARACDGDAALKCMDLFTTAMLMGNLFTVHNDWRGSGIGLDLSWAPFQIDANMGFTHAVQEMLLYSDESRLDILPALPSRWQEGSVTGLHTRCGLKADIRWKDRHADIQVTALFDTRTKIYLPDGSDTVLDLRKGEAVSFTCMFG